MSRRRLSDSVSPEYLAKHLPPQAPAALPRPGQTRGRGKSGERAEAAPDQPGLLLRCTLPLEGISVNEMYVNVAGQGRRPSRKFAEFKARAEKALLHTAWIHPDPGSPRPLLLRMVFYGRWHHLDGSPRRRDLSNLVKATEDVICAALGMDDRWVYRAELEKRHASTPRITVDVIALEEGYGQT